MPFGLPHTDDARTLQHKLLHGNGAEPPAERLGLGPKDTGIWDLMPALPLEFGVGTLPLPRKLMREMANS